MSSTERVLPANELSDGVSETPFYISAVGPAIRPRRILKYGDTFAVFDSHGDIGGAVGGAEGLFHNDTRYLSQLELLMNGQPDRKSVV